MSSRGHQSRPVPEDLETPDIGFVAATGVYTAAVLVALTLTLASTIGTSTSTLLGVFTTVVTAGLVVGAIVSSRLEGLPERLGSSPRCLAACVLPAAAFAAIASLGAFTPVLPRATTLGAGAGAVLTFAAALGIDEMSRTRYARAMRSDEPLASFPLVDPNRGRGWLAAGLGCLAIAVVLAHPGTEVLTRVDSVRTEPFWWFLVAGSFLCYFGLSFRLGIKRAFEDQRGPISRRLLPEDTRRTVAGTTFSLKQDVDPAKNWHTELEVHEHGLVVKRTTARRYLPWSSIAGVRLEAEELLVERRRWVDLRCARSVIDDPDGVAETIERARTDASRE